MFSESFACSTFDRRLQDVRLGEVMVLVEDVYLFRTMTTGVLLIELCIFLLNQEIEKMGGQRSSGPKGCQS